MSNTPLNDAELSFFDALSGFDKTAVSLSRSTQQALGVEGIPPEGFDELEGEIASAEVPKESQGRPASAFQEQPRSFQQKPAPSQPEPQSFQEQPESSHEELAQSEIEQHAPHLIDASAKPSDKDLVPEEAPSEQDEAPAVEPPVPAVPDRASDGRVFSALRSHPLRIYDVLNAKYGVDTWVFWEPETLWWAIRRDFGPVGEVARNKIQALMIAALTYTPWGDWDVFENCGLAWNDLVPIFGAYQPMTPSQIAFTVSIMETVHPGPPWDNEVSAYIAMILEENGFAYAPEEWFPGAQALLDRKSEFAGFKVDVEKAWLTLGKKDLSGVEWREDNPVDIHIAKLLVVRSYLEARAELRSGTPALEQAPVNSTPTSPPVA